MNKSHSIESVGSIVSTIGSADISATMIGVGSDFELSLEGEVQDLAGVLNNDAAYAVKAKERAEGIASEGEWSYYAQALAGEPGRFFKVWVRWNAEQAIYDYYLDAKAGEIFSHVTPYIGTLFL